MKEQKHMLGRNKNKKMLEQKGKEQKLKEQKHMNRRKQKIHYYIGTTYVTAWNIKLMGYKKENKPQKYLDYSCTNKIKKIKETQLGL
jgi:hypothetical protein